MARYATQNATHTLLGLYAQLAAVMPPANPNYQTEFYSLNTKYQDTLAGTSTYPTGHTPSVKYFGVGIGGRKYITEAGGNITSVRPIMPSTENQDLYKPVPVRCVPASADLSTEERANYRIRTTTTMGGTPYILYWLKVIEKDDGGIKFTAVDGTGTLTPYTFASHLTPTPPANAATGATIKTSANRITVGFTGTCELTSVEMDENVKAYIESNSQFYLNPDYVISEVGIYHGVDASVTIGGVTYTEAYGTQLATHICYEGLQWPTAVANFVEKVLLQHGSALLS